MFIKAHYDCVTPTFVTELCILVLQYNFIGPFTLTLTVLTVSCRHQLAN